MQVPTCSATSHSSGKQVRPHASCTMTAEHLSFQANKRTNSHYQRACQGTLSLVLVHSHDIFAGFLLIQAVATDPEQGKTEQVMQESDTGFSQEPAANPLCPCRLFSSKRTQKESRKQQADLQTQQLRLRLQNFHRPPCLPT